MRLHGKVFVAMLLVLFTAGQAWAAFCWSDGEGGTVVLEIGQGVGPFVPVMGNFIRSPADGPCLGQLKEPFHGIARIIPEANVALVGFSSYATGSSVLACAPVLGEVSINLSTLVGTGFTLEAPHFDMPHPTTLTPSACP